MKRRDFLKSVTAAFAAGSATQDFDMPVDPRPTIEAPDDDPYLWLEEIEHPRVLDWVEAQNAATLERFSDARVAADRKVLKAIFDRPDNIPAPNRRGDRLFNSWRDRKSTRLNSSHQIISYAVFC